MKIKPYYLLVLLALLITACQKPTLTLAKDGQSDYEIAYESTTTSSAFTAAELLQEYFKAITGVALPIRPATENDNNKKIILVGITPDAVASPESIHITTNGEHISLLGGSAEATTNAVYTFLQDFLGCRWYAPDATEIPTNSNLQLAAIDYSYTPEITTRTVHSRLYYENPDFAAVQKVTNTSFPYYIPEARVHTFHRFLPEETYYASHPEYYALRDGKRLPTQLCLTNPEVLELVNQKVADLFEKHPDAAVLSVSQDDNQQHCQCDQCSAIDTEEGSPAGTMIRFVNAVAENFPCKTISTLAYQYTRKPPKTRPRKNVLITLCSIECDRSAPIAEKCTDFADDLRGWSALTENVRIWDYTTQFTNFLAPFPNLYTLQDNVQLFRDNNAKWVFEQHSNNPSELFELRSYITAQLLWNPDQDFDALLTDFVNGYYGAAGPFIKEYITTIHKELEKKDFFLFLYGDPSQAFDAFLRPELLERYTSLFDQAEKAVKQNSKVLNRVKMARLGVDYAVLEASRKNLNTNLQLITTNTAGKKAISPRVEKLLHTFETTTKANNIRLMNEMGFTVEEYTANYHLAVTTASKPNKAVGKKVVTLTKPTKYANEDPLVLTDGALGGSSFFANWLGYVGNDLEVIVDLEQPTPISSIDLSFLQVTNHVVFFPNEVTYMGSTDGKNYLKLATLKNNAPLTKESKVNAIQNFGTQFKEKQLCYIKVIAKNTPTPYWHHAAGLPSWVFADEIIIN